LNFKLPSTAPQAGLPNGLPSLGPTFGPQLPLAVDGERPTRSPDRQQGELRVKIDVANLPPGSRVTKEKSGGLFVNDEVSVGFADPLALGY
jgi:hypothetical protein